MRGSCATDIVLSEEATQADLRSGALFSRLREYVGLNYLLGAASPNGRDVDVSARGIVQGHAYALLRVEECDGVQLVQARNPWGKTEWSGPWGDADKTRWSKRARKLLAYDPDQSGDDGTFWLTLEDFCTNFERVYVCRIFPTIAEGGVWYVYSASGAWSKASGSKPGTAWANRWRNPQFGVALEEPGSVFVSLEQLHTGATLTRARAGLGAIYAELFDAQGRGRAEMPQRDWRSPADVSVFRSPFTFERQVVAESAGAVGGPASGAGSGELALICACQEDDADERHFVVTVRCTAPLRADSLEADGRTLRLLPLTADVK